MTGHLRIAVGDDEPETRRYFEDTLAALGHEVVCCAADGRQLVDGSRATRPDLIITDIKMPELDGIAAAAEICREHPIPVILVSAFYDEELIRRALEGHVLAYLVKPIKQADIETAIPLAMRRFKEFQALHQQAHDLRQTLEDRKLIERAKGILMKRAGLDEPSAFRRLQRLSSDKNQKMVEIARMLLAAEEAFIP